MVDSTHNSEDIEERFKAFIDKLSAYKLYVEKSTDPEKNKLIKDLNKLKNSLQQCNDNTIRDKLTYTQNHDFIHEYSISLINLLEQVDALSVAGKLEDESFNLEWPDSPYSKTADDYWECIKLLVTQDTTRGATTFVALGVFIFLPLASTVVGYFVINLLFGVIGAAIGALIGFFHGHIHFGKSEIPKGSLAHRYMETDKQFNYTLLKDCYAQLIFFPAPIKEEVYIESETHPENALSVLV